MTKEDLIKIVSSELKASLNTEISLVEDVFDAGVDSVAAENLLIKLEEKLGFEIPGWVLLDNPTVETFAAATMEFVSSS